MKNRNFLNQAITLLMATMLILVGGARSWSEHKEVYKVTKEIQQDADDSTPKGTQATISTLSLNAVITPAVSFDFFQSFYLLPAPVWSFVLKSTFVRTTYTETAYLFTCFSRIFARYIVTNAP